MGSPWLPEPALVSLPRWGGVAAMRRQGWRIEWRGRAQADGLERLGQAVRLIVDRAQGVVPKEETAVGTSPPGGRDREEIAL